MTSADTLILLPTYNEVGNIEKMYKLIRCTVPDAEILFIDDKSPDGTGRVIDNLSSRDPSVHVIHRAGKSGIGSAHKEGIDWAYKYQYSLLVTMDCDFAHSPSYLAEFISRSRKSNVVIGTRFVLKDSLSEWNLFRKCITYLGHFLTWALLALPFDCTGAFRCYNLKSIPKKLFELIPAKDYAFFFQSLNILYLNNIKIVEVPISLPARTYGSSKMSLLNIFGGILQLITHAWLSRFHRGRFLLKNTCV